MTRRPAPRGMTLVELMVGLAIGLFLVAVISTMYLGSRNTFVAQETGSRLQENGRFAMDTIANDLRMSGFRGCMPVMPTGNSAAPLALGVVDNTLLTPTDLRYNFGEPIWGARNAGAAWSPALAAPVNGLGAVAAGDVLLVRRPAGVAWALVAEMPTRAAALTITPTANFQRGDLLMVADCAGASVLQATNMGPGAAGSIQHVPGAGGVVPGLSTANLARTYSNDARVWRMQARIYYLADSERRPGETALWLHVSPAYDGEAQTSELVTGVERMAVTYGVDNDGLDGAGNLSANRFFHAGQVTNWAQVVSARVEMVLTGADDNQATAAQPYVFAGQTITPTDRKMRTVMSVLVSLRNTVP
ncbi:MAG: PilW family protein [Aquabacterium sp.]|nr:PilW family protein [Aquabacterium sp.]